jgi:hypothetical protein
MPAFDQTIKWLKYQLFAFSNVIEDFVAKNKVAAVDPNLGLLIRTQPSRNSL